MSRERADRVAAWATGAGIGFMVLMLGWLVGNRVAGLIWDPPLAPTLAIAAAVVAGATATVVAGRRLARRAEREDEGRPARPREAPGS